MKRGFGKRYLVSGASGLFGSMACFELSKRNDVAGIYHRHPVYLPRTKTFQLDLQELALFDEVLRTWRPDVLIHAAALVDVEYCEAHPEECLNFHGSLVREISRLCRERDIKMVSLSTDAFFEMPPGHRATEEMAPNIDTAYGRSKLMGEKEVLGQAPNSLVVRTNIYGWNALEKFSLAEWILDGLIHGKELTMFQDVTYSPILVNHLVRALEALVDADERGLYHVASSDFLTKLDFGRKVAEQFGLSSAGLLPASVADKKFIAKRSKNMSLSTSKFESRFPGLLRSISEDLVEFQQLLRLGVVDQIRGRVCLPELRR